MGRRNLLGALPCTKGPVYFVMLRGTDVLILSEDEVLHLYRFLLRALPDDALSAKDSTEMAVFSLRTDMREFLNREKDYL